MQQRLLNEFRELQSFYRRLTPKQYNAGEGIGHEFRMRRIENILVKRYHMQNLW